MSRKRGGKGERKIKRESKRVGKIKKTKEGGREGREEGGEKKSTFSLPCPPL